MDQDNLIFIKMKKNGGPPLKLSPSFLGKNGDLK